MQGPLERFAAARLATGKDRVPGPATLELESACA